MLGEVELVLVIGSRNSSNSNRLVEVARAGGVPAYLIDDEKEIEELWLEGVESVGLTSGASAPERLVQSVCAWFRERGATEIRPHRSVREDVSFRLPLLAREDSRQAEAAA
jgi:4-hydroxy-3-methylbut-2-enyl diphosphate reductase